MIIAAIKFIMLLFKIVLGLACIIIVVITVGAFVAAVVSVFPVVGIILGVIVISVIIYKIIIFIKDKKEEKLFKEAEENRLNFTEGKNNDNSLFK